MDFKRLFLLILGWMCLILGFLTFWLPLPTGAILMAVGLALLLTASPRAVRVVKRLRHRHRRLDRFLHRIYPHMPRALKRALARTRVRRWRRIVLDGDHRLTSSKPRRVSLAEPANDQSRSGSRRADGEDPASPQKGKAS